VYIKNISINKFSSLCSFEKELSQGLNVICGTNESGKSTLCAFIKYALYGFENKAERMRYIGFGDDGVSGSLTLAGKDGSYRISRETSASGRENLRVIREEDGAQIDTGEEPGRYFFGISASVFEATVFVRQLEGSRVAGGDMESVIENILFSADEKVDTKKALKRLDDARAELLHKNKKGGKIYETELALEELEREKEDSEQRGREISEKTATLKELKEKYRQKYDRKKLLEEELKQYKNGKLAIILKEAKAHKASLEGCRLKEVMLKAKYSKAGYTPEEEYLAELCGFDTRKKALEKKLSDTRLDIEKNERNSISEEDRRAFDILSAKGGRAYGEKSCRSTRTAGLIFLILAVIAALSCVFLETPLLFAAIGVSALFLLLSLICHIRLTGFLKSFGVKKVKELSERLADIEQTGRFISERESMAKLLKEKESSLEAELRALEAETEELIQKSGKESLEEAIAYVREGVELFDSLAKEQEKYSRLFEISFAPLREYSKYDLDQIEKTAPSEEWLKEYPYDQAKKEYEFYDSTLGSHGENIHSLEKQLAALSAGYVPADELSAKKEELISHLKALRKKYDAVTLASETLEEAGKSLKGSIGPKIASKAAAHLALLSRGRYAHIGFNEKLELEYRANKEGALDHGIAFMSAGTADITYIALRLALAELLSDGENLPLIFDESFVRLDRQRLVSMLKLLWNTLEENRGSHSQALVFTSHEREAALMKDIGDFTQLDLG